MTKHYTKKQIGSIAGAVMLMMGYGIINAGVSYFVAPVTEDLAFQRSSFTLYYTIMNVVATAVMPFAGRIVKRYEPRRILAVGLAGGLGCIAAFSLASQLWHFYILGAMVGLFKDSCTLLMVGVVMNRTFGRKSGTPIGIAMSGSGLCGILLGLVMPAILERYGWRCGYLFQAAAWAVIFGAAILLLRDPEPEEEDAVQMSGDYTTRDVTLKEAKHSVWLYLMMLALIMMSAPGNFLLHMPSYYVEQGLSAKIAGKIISFYSFGIMLFKIVEGHLFDKIGDVKTTVLTMGVFAIGLWVSLSTVPLALYIGAVLLSFGMAALTVLPPLLTRNVFGQREYASIYGLISMTFAMANAVGAPMWGLIHDASGSYQWGVRYIPWMILLGMSTMALILRNKDRLFHQAEQDLKSEKPARRKRV